MKRLIFIIFIWAMRYSVGFAQSAHLTFVCDEDVTLRIYLQMDEVHNRFIPNEMYELEGNNAFEYDLDVDGFVFIDIGFAMHTSTSVLVFPGDSIEISCKGNDILFQGANASGQSFLTFNWSQPYVLEIPELFNQYKKGQSDLLSIDHKIENYKLAELLAIETLKNSGEISDQFYKLLQLYISFCFDRYLFWGYEELALKDNPSDQLRQDSAFIHNKISELFGRLPDIEPFLMKIPRYINYMQDYFSYQSDQDTIFIPEGYNKDDFGVAWPYLKFPKKFHPATFGITSFFTIMYSGYERMDPYKIFAYLSRDFPDSDYVKVLGQMLKEVDEETEKVANIMYLEEEITSLSDLIALPEFSDKYIYIDLWASWCGPCHAEFIHKKEQDSLLENYKNVVALYISIDDLHMEEAWKKQINVYGLSGFHLRASRQLTDELGDLIYGDEPMMIPRYFLLNPKGEILNDDLPRPSDLVNLRKALDEWLERKDS